MGGRGGHVVTGQLNLDEDRSQRAGPEPILGGSAQASAGDGVSQATYIVATFLAGASR